MKETIFGLNEKSSLGIQGSLLGLTFYNQKSEEIKFNKTKEPFELKIPIEANNFNFNYINSSLISEQKLLTFKIDTNNLSSNIYFLLSPNDTSSSFAVFINYNFYKILCPKDLTLFLNRSVYKLYLNNISSSFTIKIGLKELSIEENKTFCERNNNSIKNKEISGKVFLNEISVFILQRGCYYLEKSSGLWRADGVELVDDLSLSYTNCRSYHLTDFSGGLVILPARIDFDAAFANSSYEQNKTVYTVLIGLSIIYVVLFVCFRYMDYRDEIKSRIYFLDEYFSECPYFYEIILFTGNRMGAGTKSNVILIDFSYKFRFFN